MTKVSFEFFPPNNEAMEITLWGSIQRLAPLNPHFVSVTYGADGSTRERTHNIVKRIQQTTKLVGAPHLTCVGATRGEILSIAENYWNDGIRHIVALRGDPPKDKNYVPPVDGFDYTHDLVKGLVDFKPFEISVGCYPEVHPNAKSAQDDIDNLKRKIDAGAARAITQFFFNNDSFYRFRDACVKANIAVPIVPGILPIVNFQRMLKFAERCRATVPQSLHERFAKDNVAVDVAVEQILDLQKNGVNEFHFYTLNRAELTYAICEAIRV